MNLSPRSGGVYRLVEGLACHADLSRHSLVYVRQRYPPGETGRAMPDNVRVVYGSPLGRIAFQALLASPLASPLLRGRRSATAVTHALLRLGGITASQVADVDGWLWPHCFRPLPNLPNHMVISHDMIHHRFPEYFGRGALRSRSVAESMLDSARLILCPSQASADDLCRAYPSLADRVRPFSAAPPQELETPAPHVVEDVRRAYDGLPILLFVGVDWAHKNHKVLIDAAVLMRERGTPFRMVFAGNRRGDDIARSIRAAGVQEVVIDEAAVTAHRLAALYAAARVFLFPSRCEGFGLPLVEAMRASLPIVAANSACVAEVMAGCGTLLSADDPQAWCDTLTHLLDDPARLAAFADTSAARGATYTWQRTWASLDAIFDEATA